MQTDRYRVRGGDVDVYQHAEGINDNIWLFPDWEHANLSCMRIVARRTLREFWERHAQAEGPLRAWFSRVEHADWRVPSDIKASFGHNVDFVADNRVIFDIAGNKYRLIVHVMYERGRVLIKFVGTHAEYDRIDPETA